MPAAAVLKKSGYFKPLNGFKTMRTYAAKRAQTEQTARKQRIAVAL